MYGREVLRTGAGPDQPSLPMKPGRAQTMTHDYKRNGTATLFAALDVLTGKVIGQCLPRHRHTEFLKFLRTIDREVPEELAVPRRRRSVRARVESRPHEPAVRARGGLIDAANAAPADRTRSRLLSQDVLQVRIVICAA